VPTASDVQGFVNPPRVKGRGQQGRATASIPIMRSPNISMIYNSLSASFPVGQTRILLGFKLNCLPGNRYMMPFMFGNRLERDHDAPGFYTDSHASLALKTMHESHSLGSALLVSYICGMGFPLPR
jgi:hypothetical protein